MFFHGNDDNNRVPYRMARKGQIPRYTQNICATSSSASSVRLRCRECKHSVDIPHLSSRLHSFRFLYPSILYIFSCFSYASRKYSRTPLTRMPREQIIIRVIKVFNSSNVSSHKGTESRKWIKIRIMTRNHFRMDKQTKTWNKIFKKFFILYNS